MNLTLKQARMMNDLTVKEIAEKLNVCPDTYRKIEKNPERATIAIAKKVSEITGIPYDVIFFGGESSLSRQAS